MMRILRGGSQNRSQLFPSDKWQNPNPSMNSMSDFICNRDNLTWICICRNFIVDRELYPIATLFNALGPHFEGQSIKIWIDNLAAVWALIKKDIRNEKCQDLVVIICEIAMKYAFRFLLSIFLVSLMI